MRKFIIPAIAALGMFAATGVAQAQNKHNGDPKSPISTSVFVPAGSDMVYVSGLVPDVINLGADGKLPAGVAADFGDTETQVRSILKKIEAALAVDGFGMGDVVMMRIVLVAPTKDGVMDRAGMMKAYLEKFGTAAQPMKPARITTQIAGLGMPGMWAEIEVQAAKKK